MSATKPTCREIWCELKGRVDEELARAGTIRRAPASIWIKVSLLLISLAASYTGIILLQPGPLWLLLWAQAGVTTFFLMVCAAHDASHGVLSASSLLNRIALLVSFGLLGIDGALWGVRHRAAHHAHTNVSEVDPDSSPNPFLRLSPHHPWRPWFRFQAYYAILLYPLALAHTAIIQDFEHLVCRSLPYVDKLPSRRVAFLRALLIKVVYLLVFVILPWKFLHVPLVWVLVGVATKFLVASTVFVLTICLNHYVTETTFYDTTSHPAEDSHLMHQLRSSADWYPTSTFWCWLMGGANAHTAHHLFPSVSHAHYPAISRIIQETAQKYNLPYNTFSFTQGLRSHFTFLNTLGRYTV